VYIFYDTKEEVLSLKSITDQTIATRTPTLKLKKVEGQRLMFGDILISTILLISIPQFPTSGLMGRQRHISDTSRYTS
jgi:hypothetical protein